VSRICILGIDHAAIKTARLEETQIFSRIDGRTKP